MPGRLFDVRRKSWRLSGDQANPRHSRIDMDQAVLDDLCGRLGRAGWAEQLLALGGSTAGTCRPSGNCAITGVIVRLASVRGLAEPPAAVLLGIDSVDLHSEMYRDDPAGVKQSYASAGRHRCICQGAVAGSRHKLKRAHTPWTTMPAGAFDVGVVVGKLRREASTADVVAEQVAVKQLLGAARECDLPTAHDVGRACHL